MSDYKDAILDNLKAVRLAEQKNKQLFKVKAYTKVIKQIEAMTTPITCMADLKAVSGVGEGIATKLATIFDQGYLNAAKDEMQNLANEKVIEELTKIMGIGDVKARELVEQHNILTIDQLRENLDLLNGKQQLGLRYHDDFLKRIPRKEMDKHREFIEAAMPSTLTFEVAGSYRRGLADSGDIDVLVTTKDGVANNVRAHFESIVTALKANKYLKDDFAFGKEKYLGVSKLPRYKSYRRIDIMYIPRDKFAFALLYFTGSQGFNIKMRTKALEKGFSLSEHGLKYTKGPNKGEFVSGTFSTEADVFAFLDMPFVAPVDRK